MRLSHLSPLVLLFALGCAGRTDPAADEVNLVLSEPSGGANVNLTRFDTANDWQRSRPSGGLTVSATQTPGPTGLSTRLVRTVIASPTPGVEYSLTSGGLTYVELSETSTSGTRVWRSEGGLLHLLKDDSKTSDMTLGDVIMAPFSGNAQGKFKIAGKVVIRF